LSSSLSTYATQANLNSSINTLSGQISTATANTQPLDTTNTLTSIPKTVQTMTNYFSGFPNDQLSWSVQSSATFTNISGNPKMQQLNFANGDSFFSVSIPNTISTSTTCTVSVAVKLNTVNGFTMNISKGTTTLAYQIFSNVSENLYSAKSNNIFCLSSI
jgi:hypothetical protein